MGELAPAAHQYPAVEQRVAAAPPPAQKYPAWQGTPELEVAPAWHDMPAMAAHGPAHVPFK